MTDKTTLLSPLNDQSLSEEERQFVNDLLHSYGQMVKQNEQMFSDTCQHQGVPEHICIRAMIQILQHRAGTLAAHLLADSGADDIIVEAQITELSTRMKDVVRKQMTLSRKTVDRIGPRP